MTFVKPVNQVVQDIIHNSNKGGFWIQFFDALSKNVKTRKKWIVDPSGSPDPQKITWWSEDQSRRLILEFDETQNGMQMTFSLEDDLSYTAHYGLQKFYMSDNDTSNRWTILRLGPTCVKDLDDISKDIELLLQAL